MPDPDDFATSSLEQQQILAFLHCYLRDNDCFPTTREVALACGFGSSHTAARILADLESAGAIIRDRRFSRLGSLVPAGVGPSIPDQEQLWWCERDCIEYEAALAANQVGLDLAPDLDASAFLYAEGLSRVTVLRALHDARQRLRHGGTSLTHEGETALGVQREVATAAHRLLTDWDSYCAVRLVWNLSALEGLHRVRPLALGYLGASLVASRRSTESVLPTYRAWAQPGLDANRVDPALWRRLEELLGALRRDRARHCPSQRERPDVDVLALLAGAH
jgi:hypothetical protein